MSRVDSRRGQNHRFEHFRLDVMRAIFGVVSLLVVLVSVGLLASRQLKTMSSPVASAAASAVPAPTGTAREQSQQLQQRVATDVTKALEQGARNNESDK